MFELLLSLVPIFAVALIFLLTRKTFYALIAGCLVGSIVIAGTDFSLVFELLFYKFLAASEINNLFSVKFFSSSRLLLMFFIFFTNILIAMIHESGLFYGYYNFLRTKVNSKKGAELSSLILGLILFVDDYLSVMTNAKISSMFCSKFAISRMKIAFLVGTLAAPLCTLIPISSWSAEILSTISGSIDTNSLFGMDAFLVYAKSIPFVLFSLCLAASGFFVVLFNSTFGVLKKEESVVCEVKNDNIDELVYGKVNLFQFLIPVFLLISSVVALMAYFGGYPAVGLFASLQKNPFPEKALFFGTLVSVLFSTIYLFSIKMVSVSGVIEAVKIGFFETKDILFLLTFSNMFGRFLSEIGTGRILASAALPYLSPAVFLVAIFILTAMLAFLLGSAWATISIMIPVALPMYSLFDANPEHMLVVIIGAILSAVIFGSGLSPVSELVMMNSRSSKVSHEDFLRVQFDYLFPIGVLSACSFFAINYFLLSGRTLLFCWLIGVAPLIIFSNLYFFFRSRIA